MKAKKLIALTDLETSGDIPFLHEILEIGLIVFDTDTFEIVDTYTEKVKPLHIETAVPEAISYNGWSKEKWTDAKDLKEVMRIYGEKTKNTVFCAYNVSFDWSFIVEAFRKVNIPNPMSTQENHDRLDLLSIAWLKGLKNTSSFSLKNACMHFGVDPEPDPHTALAGTETAYRLFRKLIG